MKYKNKKIWLALTAMLLLLISFTSALPVPVSISGTTYDLDGEQVSTQISLRNLDNGYYVEGRSGRLSNQGKFVFSLQAELGDNIVLTAWNEYHNVSRNLSLEGVMSNVNLYLNTTIPNIPPKIISSPNLIAYEDQAYEYQVLTDEEVSYSVIGPEGMSISNSGLVAWLPEDNNAGIHEISVIVSDEEFDTWQNYSLEVIRINDPPKIISGYISTASEDVQYVLEVIAVDEENDSLTYSIEGINAFFDENVLLWTPSQSNVGIRDVSIVVSDGLNEVRQNFSINVTATNDAPRIISSPKLLAYEDKEYSYELWIEDEDNNEFEIFVYGISAKINNNTIYYTPRIPGTVLVEVLVSDGELNASQIFNLSILNTNDAPRITSEPETKVYTNQKYEYEIIALDEDNDLLSYKIIESPDKAKLNNNIFSWNPNAKYEGKNKIILEVSDGNLSVRQEFELRVYKPSSNVVKEEEEFNVSENLSQGLNAPAQNFEEEVIVEAVEPAQELFGYLYENAFKQSIDEDVDLVFTNLRTGKQQVVTSKDQTYSLLLSARKGDKISVSVDGTPLLTALVSGDLNQLDFVRTKEGYELFKPDYSWLYYVLGLISLLVIGAVIWRQKV